MGKELEGFEELEELKQHCEQTIRKCYISERAEKEHKLVLKIIVDLEQLKAENEEYKEALRTTLNISQENARINGICGFYTICDIVSNALKDKE